MPSQPAENRDRSDSIDLEELLGIKDSGSSMNLLDIWYLVKERWLLGLVVGTSLAAIVAFMIMRQPKQYESFVQFDLTGEERVFNPLFANSGDTELDAHVTKVTSQNFYDYLADALDTKPELQTALGGPDRVAVVSSLSRSIRAAKVNRFVRASVRHSSPEVAADLANEIGLVYKMYDEKAKAEELKDTEATLVKELADTKTALDEVNRKIFELGERAPMPSNELDLPKLQLQQLNDQIPPLAQDIRDQEIALESVNRSTDLQEKISIGPLAASTSVMETAKSYRAAITEKETLENEGLGPAHQDMIAATAKVRNERVDLEAVVNSVVAGLESKLKNDRQELARVETKVDALNAQIAGRGEHAGEFGKLETQRDQYKARMKDHQTRLAEIRIHRNAGLSKLETLDRALPNYTPVTPDKRLAILASFVVFSLGMFCLPVAIGLMDTRLKSISEIERFLGIDCLATMPAKKDSEVEDLGLAVMMAQDEAIVESFRVLYSSLRMISHNDYPQAILVTSSAPSEGKSFISTNIAAFFAEQGKRTLIIDCDFRKPTQHRNVKESNDQGIIRWYHSDEPVPQDPDQFGESKALGFLALGESENLFLLRAGGTSKSPTAMIESTRFAQLVHTLRSYFDVIIFDTPPVGLFPDALFVADYTNEAIFVHKFHGLNRHKVKFALSQLQKAGCNVLGVVVNYLTTRAATGYGYGYSDYGYGHYSSKDYARYYSTNDSK